MGKRGGQHEADPQWDPGQPCFISLELLQGRQGTKGFQDRHVWLGACSPDVLKHSRIHEKVRRAEGTCSRVRAQSSSFTFKSPLWEPGPHSPGLLPMGDSATVPSRAHQMRTAPWPG